MKNNIPKEEDKEAMKLWVLDQLHKEGLDILAQRTLWLYNWLTDKGVKFSIPNCMITMFIDNRDGRAVAAQMVPMTKEEIEKRLSQPYYKMYAYAAKGEDKFLVSFIK